MHCIAHRANFTATSDNFTLHLAVQYLVNSQSLQDDRISKISPLNVIAQNPLLFTLSGSKDGLLATNDELVISKTANQLVECLRKDLLELCLDSVSEIAVHRDGGIPGFIVTFRHTKATTEFVSTQPVLQSLHLDFAWKTRQIVGHEDDASLSSSDLYNNPFSRDLTLPLQTLLDDVVTRFVKNGLVRRYPFIFGHLAQQLINEAAYFSPIITAITRIIKRSPSPAFRSHCGELLKLLRHRHGQPHSITDQESKTCHRQMSAWKPTTTAAFHVAMQSVIKNGLKCTAFKGTRGYIMDVEEQELLEPEPRLADIPADWVSSLPLEDLSLDQGEDVSGLSQRGLSLFNTLSCPQLDDGLKPLSSTAMVELLLDTDSESEDDLIEMHELLLMPTIGGDEITIDLDEPDEGELYVDVPGISFVVPIAGLSCQSRGLPVPWPYRSESSSGIDSSLLRTKTGFYVENTSASTPQGANKGQNSVHRSGQLSKMEGHVAQQAGSGDIGTSRGKGNMDHMPYLGKWRAQDAPNDMLEIPARSPPYLNLAGPSKSLDEENELSLDTDSDLEEDTRCCPPRPDELSLKEHELTVNPNPNAYNYTCHQGEFLDVLSEELYLDDEHEMGSHSYDRGIAMDLITERDMITGSMAQRINIKAPDCEEVGSGIVFDELMPLDGEVELGAGCHDDLVLQNEATLLIDNGEELGNWSNAVGEPLFMELIT